MEEKYFMPPAYSPFLNSNTTRIFFNHEGPIKKKYLPWARLHFDDPAYATVVGRKYFEPYKFH